VQQRINNRAAEKLDPQKARRARAEA